MCSSDLEIKGYGVFPIGGQWLKTSNPAIVAQHKAKVYSQASVGAPPMSVPHLDTRVVDFSLRLPTDYKLKGLKLRWFFKEALRGFLPDEIITKKKQGFGLPFGVWAVRDAALHQLAADSLHGVAERGIVRKRFVESLLAEHLPAHPGY